MENIRVFVISSNTLFRQGLRQAFSETGDIEVVAESDINEEALEVVLSFSPVIVLLDIGLPQLTGLNLARQITQRSPAISVIVLAPYNRDKPERTFGSCAWPAGNLQKSVATILLINMNLAGW